MGHGDWAGADIRVQNGRGLRAQEQLFRVETDALRAERCRAHEIGMRREARGNSRKQAGQNLRAVQDVQNH